MTGHTDDASEFVLRRIGARRRDSESGGHDGSSRHRRDASDAMDETSGGSGLQPGARIGHFVLKRFLARGGMGQVWVATDTHLRRDVALKFIRSERADGRSQERFQREAHAGARLSHPNIVTTYAHGIEGDIVITAVGEDVHNGLVAETTSSPGLSREVLEALSGHSIWTNQLEGYLAIKAHLIGLPDLTHTTGAQWPDQLEVSELLAGLDSRSGPVVRPASASEEGLLTGKPQGIRQSMFDRSFRGSMSLVQLP